MGYHRAGFDVVGVDIKPQKNYPFEFYQVDALDVLSNKVGIGVPPWRFDAIHASPPCQAWTSGARAMGTADRWPQLIAPVRELIPANVPYVIENVTGARREMDSPLLLCGTMFDLGVFRHRYFETSWNCPMVLHTPRHSGRIGDGKYWTVVGGRWNTLPHQHRNTVADWQRAMGIDWMTYDELRESIPPAYTEYIGKQLMAVLA